MKLLHNRGPCTFCIQMQNCTRVPQPHLNCAHCLSHSLTNWPSFPYREPSAVLHLILAISRKPTRAQLIELGGSVGGLPPARHFLSFVHPAPHPWSQTSDSLRATLTQDCFWMHPERGCEMEFSCQEDWFLCGNLRCYSACIYLLYTQKLYVSPWWWILIKIFNAVAFYFRRVIHLLICIWVQFWKDTRFLLTKMAFPCLSKIFGKV